MVSYNTDIDGELQLRGYSYLFTMANWDYSWSEARVYVRDRRVFMLYSSGCSCDSFNDGWDTMDEVEGALEQVTSLAYLRQFDDDGDELDNYIPQLIALGVC